MKLTTFEINSDNRTTMGGWLDKVFVDLAVLSDGGLPDTMIQYLEAGDAAMTTARELLSGAEAELQGKTPAELTTAAGKRYAYNEDEVTLHARFRNPARLFTPPAISMRISVS